VRLTTQLGGILYRLTHQLAGVRDALEARWWPTHAIRRHELAYWRARHQAEGGQLGHTHYERAYTTYWGLHKTFYTGKRILDVGCGPRGSLEWATMAAERVGVDPLVPQYRRLGIDGHQMTYVAAPAEALPFPDAHFDVVTVFNALDHVNDPRRVVGEVARVTRPGGLCLVLVEVNHPPTPTEPQTLPWSVADWFKGGYTLNWQRAYELGPRHDMYGQLFADARYDEADPTDRAAWLALRLERRA
jgi:SAM-dependent methyltransferase